MEIAKKKRSLIAHKGQVTKAVQKLDEYLRKPETDDDVIQEYVETVNKRFSKMEDLQDDLSELIEDEDEMTKVNEEIDTYLVMVQDIRIKARKKIQEHVLLTSAAPPTSKLCVKLPEIQLPKFSGNILEFPRFWDLFASTIDKDTNLSAVHKFTYLTGCLEDEAADLVKELRVTEDNYAKALELLQDRYHRPDALIFKHIQSLLHLEVGKQSSDNLSKLRAVIDKVNIHIRSLETLGIDGVAYGVILVPLILSRLPNEIVTAWSRKSKGKERDLKYLLELCKDEIMIKERAKSVRINNPHESERQKLQSDRNIPHRPTAAALTTIESKCIFCQRGGHEATRCKTVGKFTWDQITDAIKKSGACYRCLQRGHIAKTCRAVCSLCGKGHHQNICRPRETSTPHQQQEKAPEKTDDSSSAMTISCVAQSTQDVFMQMATIRATGKKTTMSCNVLFDSGSNQTYITKRTADRLGCMVVDTIQHSVVVFGGKRSESKEKAIREVSLLDMWGKPHTLQALETSDVCAPLTRPRLPAEVLKEIKVADQPTGNVVIDILVGLDHYWQFFGNQIHRLGEGLVAHNTPFGNIVSGQIESGTKRSSVSHQLFVMTETNRDYWNRDTEAPETDIRRLWNLEWLGLGDDKVEENGIFAKFRDELEFNDKDKRYSTKLPWKPISGQLQNNYNSAKKRCIKQFEKLSSDQCDGYLKVFQDWEENGIIESVSPSEIDAPDGRQVFYLPHRPVIREESLSTKIRPVFDGGAKGPNGLSINDVLHTGPKLQNDIVDILMRFRTHPVALNADISKAFLQIQLNEADRDCCRFLLPCKNGSLKIMRFTRLPFGLNCSPFILNASVLVHLSKYHGKTAEELKRNLYVDDWLSGATTLSDANELYQEANEIMKDASMPLAKWRSNEKEFKDGNIPESKVLGLFWDSSLSADEFHYSGLKLPDDVIVTKRLILSCIARVFDPLGYLGPFLITAKILFQRAWFQGVEWDQEVPPDISNEFKKWIAGLQRVRDEVKIPRKYLSNAWPEGSKDLVVFCDASEQAYGAAVYLKTRTELSLVIAKARVAPLKKISLPRLELIACVMGTQLLTKVKSALTMEKAAYTCYTDSQIALQYLKQCPDKWKPFIANRVRTIQELSDPVCWYHIPGEQNPADALTRGVPATKFLVNLKSWTNPTVGLCVHQTISNSTNSVFSSTDLVEAPEKSVLTIVEAKDIEPMVFGERWSTISKAVRVLAFAKRFIGNCKAKDDKITGTLTSEEIERAKEVLIKCSQKLHFQHEIELLKKDKPLQRTSRLYPLTPFIDDSGVLRIKGRLQNSVLTYEDAHPVIMPGDWISRLIVRDYHQVMKHSGVSTLMNGVRQKYWVIGLRRIAKAEVKSCFQCQRIQAPACNQPSPSLPKERVTKHHPFEVTGVDYAGPLYVKDTDEKQYICLYTCMTVRAVHLELTSSLNVKEFLNSFRRFAARRGIPKTMCSDNGRTFVNAKDKLVTMYGDQTPQWKFIAPRSPWRGGCWERMVRTVKTHLKKVLGNRSVTKHELETLLYEIEYTVNTRPLTTVTDAPGDLRPLTPADFLLNREILDISTPSDAQRSFAKGTQQLQRFWKLWSTAYLKGLPNLVPQFKDKCTLEKGSVVLIREDNLPRLRWPLARVMQLIPSEDGRIRTVKLQTNKGIRVRPVQRIHILEEATPDATSDDVPADEPQMIPTITKEKPEKPSVTTRCGRQTRKPNRLDI